ncbi:protein NIM1-interacting 2 [Tanacetum coccineum]
MEKDQRKRSRALDGGDGSGGGVDRKKGKDVVSEPVVTVAPPTEDEVEEFFAILRRMRDAVKYLEKGGGGVKVSVEAGGESWCLEWSCIRRGVRGFDGLRAWAHAN